MAWDAQNRMASCTLNGTTSTFTYGSDGLRRRMVTGTNTTDYLLDGQNVVREIKNGVVNATYLNGPRGPEYKRDQNGAVQWYLYDGLGSVVGLVDESGNVTNSRKYDVYGAPRNAQAGTAHCFVGGLGHTSDAETGLIYMRARYYDPATGRFVSEDPACYGVNWFAYCGGNPVCLSDPTGCWPEGLDYAEFIGQAIVALGWAMFKQGRRELAHHALCMAGAVAGGLAANGLPWLGPIAEWCSKTAEAMEGKMAVGSAGMALVGIQLTFIGNIIAALGTDAEPDLMEALIGNAISIVAGEAIGGKIGGKVPK